MVRVRLIERFISSAQASGAEVVRLTGTDEAVGFVSSFLEESGRPSFVVSPEVLDQLAGAASLASPLPQTREEWMRTEVSLVRADYGLARTGTLVHLDRSEEERLSWTLASACLCLLSTESIVDGAEELAPVLAAHLGRRDLLSPAVSLVTGPSRTADIEGQLICGVHGPKRLIILLLNASTSPTDENA